MATKSRVLRMLFTTELAYKLIGEMEQQGNALRSIKMCARVIAVVADAVVALI